MSDPKITTPIVTRSSIAAALGISESALTQMTCSVELRCIEAQLAARHTELRAVEDAAIQAVVSPIEAKRAAREATIDSVRLLLKQVEDGKTVVMPDGTALLSTMK